MTAIAIVIFCLLHPPAAPFILHNPIQLLSSTTSVRKPNPTPAVMTVRIISTPPRGKVVALHQSSDSNDNIESSVKQSNWLLTLCVPLWLVYVANQWSRSSLYYLVDFSASATASKAINIDIGFDEAAYGILASVAFTTLFAIASLGAGAAADRFNRKTLTLLSATGFAIATAGTALSDSYEQVVLWRIAMGLACAFSTPTAYTLLQQRVPKENVALASSIYGTGVALASGLASLTILIDNSLGGWREALFLIAGFGGLSVIVTSLLLEDDPKEQRIFESDSAEQENVPSNDILSDVQTAFQTSRAQWIYLGSFLRFCSGLCIGVWGAPFFRMVFADSTEQYAVVQAAVSAIGASMSGVLGGAIADKLVASASSQDEDAIGRRLWVPTVGSMLAAPTWYFAIHNTESFETAMTWLALEYLVAECWFGPTISTLQSTVGPRIGGTAQGLFTLTGAVANFAPTVVGFLYSEWSGGASSETLSGLLTASVCFGYVSSAVCFGIASRLPPAELRKEKLA